MPVKKTDEQRLKELQDRINTKKAKAELEKSIKESREKLKKLKTKK